MNPFAYRKLNILNIVVGILTSLVACVLFSVSATKSLSSEVIPLIIGGSCCLVVTAMSIVYCVIGYHKGKYLVV